MIALKCILFACLVSLALATEGRNKCRHECGEKSLGVLPLLQITIGKTYPNYKITCIRCTNLLGALLQLNVTLGGYGCSNIKATVNIGALLGTCRVYGKKLKQGETAICSN